VTWICRDGLFIGVERHKGQHASQWLKSAAKDASDLRGYFAGACSEGRWDCLGSTKSPPRLVDILSAVASFAKRVPDGGSGILLFSGHAVTTEAGLALKAFDTHADFLDDTSLLLRRLFELLKPHAAMRKHFFVVMDCCRNGLADAKANDIPTNICVLYACTQGNVTYEDAKGGVLARSIIEALEQIADETGATSCSVQTLCARVARDVFSWRPALALQCELCGSGADRTRLPLARSRSQWRREQRDEPRSVITYSFGTPEEHAHGVKALGAAIFAWYGISYLNDCGKRFIEDHFKTPPQLELGVDIAVPSGCARWSASEFLAHVVDVPVVAGDRLTMHWSRRIDIDEVIGIKYAVRGEWTHGPSDEYRLIWSNVAGGGRYRGVASLCWEGSRTALYLSCETLDLDEMPLRTLLPTLADVFELFRSVA